MYEHYNKRYFWNSESHPLGEMLLRRVEDAEGVSNGEKRSDDLAGLLYEFQRVCIDSIYSCTLNDRLTIYEW